MQNREDAALPGLDTEAIVDVLAAEPVRSAVLYGSHARGEGSERSDVDLAVEFDPSLSSAERTRARLSLIERLSTRLGTDEIDVVPLSRTSPELRQEILADGILLCGSPPAQAESSTESTSDHEDHLADFDELLSKLERVV
jgi:predicted nucleotidyltransferase